MKYNWGLTGEVNFVWENNEREGKKIGAIQKGKSRRRTGGRRLDSGRASAWL